MNTDGNEENIPAPCELLKRKQGVPYKLHAEEAYYSIYRFLLSMHAEKRVLKETVEMLAMAYGRWMQAEETISEKGMLAPHPTTNVPYTSPMVQISAAYGKQVQQLWFMVWQAAKDASQDQDEADPMAKLLERSVG